MSKREYVVIFEGRVREMYLVEASSEVEARQIWSDNEPIFSDVIDGEVTEVRAGDE